MNESRLWLLKTYMENVFLHPSKSVVPCGVETCIDAQPGLDTRQVADLAQLKRRVPLQPPSPRALIWHGDPFLPS